MPRTLRSPEEILRENPGQDVYLIHFTDAYRGLKPNPKPAGRADLLSWFAKHLPHVQLEALGHSEFSGVLVGGASGQYAIHWSENDIPIYSAAWENEDGHSIDERWQCYFYPQAEYARRLAEHGNPLAREW